MTLEIRALAIGALTLLVSAGSALAQAPAPILNTVEVRKLVTSTDPADNARLAAHFAALADRYAAEAARHAAMAQAFAAAPARRAAAGTRGSHCHRLAQLNAESAQTLRELAKHHETLAAGIRSTAPRDAARFHAGEGAPEPTDVELEALAAAASTPADHRALEEYFHTVARQYEADADDHAAMALSYRGTRIAQAATHCDRLVKLGRDAAAEAHAAAVRHRQLAGAGR